MLGTEHQIEQIKYYTSWVSGRGDPFRTVRQQVYVRALRSTPNLSIHLGHFLSRPINRPIQTGSNIGTYVWVHDTREKGSDVNLASHLVWDGAQDAYDAAIVISKDTDLAEPIRIVREEINKVVGILSPDDFLDRSLKKVASFYRHIHPGDLAKSQFPESVIYKGKTIRKPTGW